MLIQAYRLGQERVDCASNSSTSAFTERGWNREREESAGSTEADVEDCGRFRGKVEQCCTQMRIVTSKPNRKVHFHFSLCRNSIRSRSTSPLTARQTQGECMIVFLECIMACLSSQVCFSGFMLSYECNGVIYEENWSIL